MFSIWWWPEGCDYAVHHAGNQFYFVSDLEVEESVDLFSHSDVGVGGQAYPLSHFSWQFFTSMQEEAVSINHAYFDRVEGIIADWIVWLILDIGAIVASEMAPEVIFDLLYLM